MPVTANAFDVQNNLGYLDLSWRRGGGRLVDYLSVWLYYCWWFRTPTSVEGQVVFPHSWSMVFDIQTVVSRIFSISGFHRVSYILNSFDIVIPVELPVEILCKTHQVGYGFQPLGWSDGCWKWCFVTSWSKGWPLINVLFWDPDWKRRYLCNFSFFPTEGKLHMRFCGVQMWCHLHDRNQPPEWKLQATNDRVFTSTDLTKGIQLWKPWVFQEHLWFHDLQHNCWVVPHFRMPVMISFFCIFRLGDLELPLTITRKDTATQTYGYDVI